MHRKPILHQLQGNSFKKNVKLVICNPFIIKALKNKAVFILQEASARLPFICKNAD